MTYGAQAMMTLPHSAVFSEAKKFLKFCERAPIIENVSSLCGDSDAPGRHLFCPMESRGAPVHEGDIGSAADERCSTGSRFSGRVVNQTEHPHSSSGGASSMVASSSGVTSGFTLTNSTSKTNAAFGGTMLPAPTSP